MAVSAVTVQHFRFRNDDGSETTATWKAAQDTSISQAVSVDTAVRLRLSLENLSAQATAALVVGLQVSHNGGVYAVVNGTSTQVQGVVSANLTDGGTTTNQLTLDTGATWIAEPGVINNTPAASGTFTSMALNTETEAEWSLLLKAAALSAGDTLDFQLVVNTGNGAEQFGSNIRITVPSSITARRRASATFFQ